MKNLSKKSVLKTEKQKLIDRINQCKTLKEVKGFKRTMSYYDILKDDQDWDYMFLINLIEFKLRRMSQYFHTHDIVVDEDWLGTICDNLISILNAGYKTDIILSDDLKDIYVNDRNVHRFFSPKELEFMLKENLQKYYLATIRERKAETLFWKYLEHHIQKLWD